MTDEAKMTGMTPAMLTLSGMKVLVPPIMRRPTMRLAYCTGMRRSPVVIQMTPTITARAMITNATCETSDIEPSKNLAIPPGRREMMLMKMRIDMPLPMPRAVISSPIHMTTVAPAVRVKRMSANFVTVRLGSAW